MSEAEQKRREDEQELIAKVRNGDANAFLDLVGDYQSRLYRKALSLVGNPDEAEDLLQEALVSAYKAMDRFRGESGIYTWLYRILVNKCRDFLRSRRSDVHESFDDFEFIISDNRLSAEKKLELSEDAEYLISKIHELDEKYREVLLLRYYEENSYEEMAEILGVQLGTVKSRLFKARELLKRILVREGRGEKYFHLS